MNPIRKAYCRIFQQMFHLAIPLLPYRKPQLLAGIPEVAPMLQELHLASVLLVTDRGIRQMGLTRPLEDALQSAGIEAVVFDGTHPNPTTDDVAAALALYQSHRCQALIGFGGGSAMDCAKAVGARVAKPRKELSQLKGILKVRHAIPPLIAIPTTAGTGSETTLAAVVVDSATRHKYAINDFPLIPRYAVLDPEVTRTLPPNLTATTGMDALTHAVEAYIGRSTTRETRADALRAVSLIFRFLPRAVQNGNDMEARQGMLEASFCAGNAFSQSYVGYVHAVAHALGGKYDIPHGLANAVLLPAVLEYYGTAAHQRLSDLAKAAGVSYQGASPAENATRFIQAIRRMQADFGIGSTIGGIRPSDIPEMARTADREANPLYPVPMEMDAKELESLFHLVMEGQNDE